jgi:hypothetical protein
MTALSHNRVRPLLWAVRVTEQISEGISDALFAGVTGGNSPHYIKRPSRRKKAKTIFFAKSQLSRFRLWARVYLSYYFSRWEFGPSCKRGQCFDCKVLPCFPTARQ